MTLKCLPCCNQEEDKIQTQKGSNERLFIRTLALILFQIKKFQEEEKMITTDMPFFLNDKDLE